MRLIPSPIIYCLGLQGIGFPFLMGPASAGSVNRCPDNGRWQYRGPAPAQGRGEDEASTPTGGKKCHTLPGVGAPSLIGGRKDPHPSKGEGPRQKFGKRPPPLEVGDFVPHPPGRKEPPTPDEKKGPQLPRGGKDPPTPTGRVVKGPRGKEPLIPLEGSGFPLPRVKSAPPPHGSNGPPPGPG